MILKHPDMFKSPIIIILIIIAAGIFITFRLTRQRHENPILAGSWTLDSVKMGADSNLVYYMLLSSMKQDSQAVDFVFTKDSLFTYAGEEADTNTFKINRKNKEMIIQGDEPEVYQFNKINDTMISLTVKDNTVLFLKKYNGNH